ncbi:MAG: hypothetical protein ACETWG_10565 [Candidatus Neomarinimicrobiota bacterium]
MKGIKSVQVSMLALLLMAGILWGQEIPAPTNLVTIPTAGTLQRGQYEFDVLMQTGGGILGRLGIGLSDRFSLGMSYGIQQFIGDEQPKINRKMPEAQLKFRIYDESYKMPALALGLETQGRGLFHEDMPVVSGEDTLTVARYDIKAIGLYLVASKNWNILGNFGSHFGICKNFLEEDETDKDINFFFGVDKDLSPGISAFIEYNAALDDNDYDYDEISFGQGRGYLNAGIRLNVAASLYMEVDFNDILTNKGEVKYLSREVKVVYNEFF